MSVQEIGLIVADCNLQAGDFVSFDKDRIDHVVPETAYTQVAGVPGTFSAKQFDPDFQVMKTPIIFSGYPGNRIGTELKSWLVVRRGSIQGTSGHPIEGKEFAVEKYRKIPYLQIHEVKKQAARCFEKGSRIWMVAEVQFATNCKVEVRNYWRSWFWWFPDRESEYGRPQQVGDQPEPVFVRLVELFKV